MSCVYRVLVLLLVVLMYPGTIRDGTCTRLVVGTLGTLAFAVVLQAAATWLPGVASSKFSEAGNAHNDAFLCELGPLGGGGGRLVLVLGSAHVSGA
jgi:hypothetical protein